MIKIKDTPGIGLSADYEGSNAPEELSLITKVSISYALALSIRLIDPISF
jgi:hypothetical protein